MASLPPLHETVSSSSSNSDNLRTALTILFESSPTLDNHLTPQLTTLLQSKSVSTYSDLIDQSLEVISSWDDGLKAQFVAGHPRIGEVNNLSHLSAQEQAAKSTPPEVLARLAHLNVCYEHRYPGLVYITFVNGRARAEIMEEMEGVLGFPHSLNSTTPLVENVSIEEAGSEEWRKELERAIVDVGRIAKSRLQALGVQ